MSYLIGLLLPGFVIAAAIFDLRSFRIPNTLVAAMLAAWPLAAWASGAPFADLATSALIGGSVLLLGIAIFARGWIGAGDVKLLSATMLYVGAANAGMFLLAMALSGAVLAIVLIYFRRVPVPEVLRSQDWLLSLHGRAKAMPYGVAIASGALFVWANGGALIA